MKHKGHLYYYYYSLPYSGDILWDKGIFLSIFLLTKTLTAAGRVWIKMTKRIKKNHKGQLLCDLNDISHLASKNFLVLQAAPCLPWKGIEQGRQKEKLKTHEAHLMPDNMSYVYGKKSHAYTSLVLLTSTHFPF